LTPEEGARAADLDARFVSDDGFYQQGRLLQLGVKIHQDVHVVEAAFKALGGLIRVIVRLREGRIDDVSISGDFTLLPSFALGALEKAIRGIKATSETLQARLQEAYYCMNIQSPGVSPVDFTIAIMYAVTLQGAA
jgi:lipoate-protein ligase A